MINKRIYSLLSFFVQWTRCIIYKKQKQDNLNFIILENVSSRRTFFVLSLVWNITCLLQCIIERILSRPYFFLSFYGTRVLQRLHLGVAREKHTNLICPHILALGCILYPIKGVIVTSYSLKAPFASKEHVPNLLPLF